MVLQEVRHQLIKYFGSSDYWIAWTWVKTEWLLERKHKRLWFLKECKLNGLVPSFISRLIQTERLFPDGDQRATRARHTYGLQILGRVHREEYREQGRLEKEVRRHHECMWKYSRRDYLFVRSLKDRAVREEAVSSERRLKRKLGNLAYAANAKNWRNQVPERGGMQGRNVRHTCIDCSLSTAEARLLEKGPKFVTTRGKLTTSELRSLESEIETAACRLRRRLMKEDEENETEEPVKKGKEEEDQQEENLPSLLNDPKVKSLTRFNNGMLKQPDKADPDTENRVYRLKDKILKAYGGFKAVTQNISQEEKEAFKTLKKEDRGIIVKCSDKSNSLVAMSEDAYKKKVMEILDNKENYEESEMTADALEELVTKKLKRIKGLKERLPPNIYKGIFPVGTRLPEFYGLPKVHKEGTPLRPVVAAFDGPMSRVSILLERILNQLLKFVPAHIWNTQDAIKSLRETYPGLKAKEGTIIVSMDVVALYPSIQIEDGIEATIQKLTLHEADIDMLGLTLGDIRELLELVLYNNYFTFNTKVYRQCEGVAMGNHLAPPFAIVFMDKLEQRMLETAEKTPALYKRYVDDNLMTWEHGEEDLLRFFAHCNTQHPNIKFTWETSLDCPAVSYMDTAISIKDGQIEHELYQKPTNSGISLDFFSAQPWSTKMSVAVQHFKRAASLSSNGEAENRSRTKIEMLLRMNNYPEHVIQEAYRRSNKPGKQQGKQARKTDEKIPLHLPFCSDKLHQELSRACRQSQLPIRIVYHQRGSIKDQLVRSAFLPATCKVHQLFEEQEKKKKRTRGKPRDDCISCRSGLQPKECEKREVVYSLQCDICQEEYVGETKRAIRARIGEHHFAARNRQANTAWGEHMKGHPEVEVGKKPVFKAKVLASTRSSITRKVREAVEIRDRKPGINKSKGWVL